MSRPRCPLAPALAVLVLLWSWSVTAAALAAPPGPLVSRPLTAAERVADAPVDPVDAAGAVSVAQRLLLATTDAAVVVRNRSDAHVAAEVGLFRLDVDPVDGPLAGTALTPAERGVTIAADRLVVAPDRATTLPVVVPESLDGVVVQLTAATLARPLEVVVVRASDDAVPTLELDLGADPPVLRVGSDRTTVVRVRSRAATASGASRDVDHGLLVVGAGRERLLDPADVAASVGRLDVSAAVTALRSDGSDGATAVASVSVRRTSGIAIAAVLLLVVSAAAVTRVLRRTRREARSSG